MPSVEHQGIAIFYETHGDGPPVVLLHSLLCSGAMWEPQLERLAERYRLINIDVRGHGRSGAVSEPCTLYDLVGDALAVLDDLEVGRAVWAGLSIGGMISLRAALVAPERVSALALLDTDAGAERRLIRFKYALLGLIAGNIGLRPVESQVVRQMFGSTTLAERPELVADWTERFRALHIPSILKVLRAVVERDDLTPRLGEIAVPALCLVGSEDRSLPPERSRALASGLARAELVEVPGAGHLSNLEQPDRVYAALAGFLDRLASSGAMD